MFTWDEVDFVEFFGALPTFYEPAHSHSFEVTRDGLRLAVTLFDAAGALYVSISRGGSAEPLFTVKCEPCTHAHIKRTASSRLCLEAGVTESPVTNMGIPPLLVRGVRVFVEPDLRVELIEPPYTGD